MSGTNGLKMIFMKMRIIEEILQEKNCFNQILSVVSLFKGMDYLNW